MAKQFFSPYNIEICYLHSYDFFKYRNFEILLIFAFSLSQSPPEPLLKCGASSSVYLYRLPKSDPSSWGVCSVGTTNLLQICSRFLVVFVGLACSICSVFVTFLVFLGQHFPLFSSLPYYICVPNSALLLPHLNSSIPL